MTNDSAFEGSKSPLGLSGDRRPRPGANVVSPRHAPVPGTRPSFTLYLRLVSAAGEVVTYTVQVTHYFGGQSIFWAKIAAMSVLGTIPVFFAVATLQRYLVRGISMGAVKG